MTQVNLGVLDVEYDDGTTTGEVAQILENNYGVMRVFAELHEQEIADDLATQMAGMLDNVKMGIPPPVGDIYFPDVESKFRAYLDAGEWEKTSGQPTMAATQGKTKRRMHKNGPRPSFIDTGLYQQSFKVWVNK